MPTIRVSNQEDMDAAIAEQKKNLDVVIQAYDSAKVQATGSAQVQATPGVAVTIHGPRVVAVGGVQLRVPRLETPATWCEYYGVPMAKGVATLYKAVDDTYKSPNGMSYRPGSVPVAPDWDGGKVECGGGLHFSPRPSMAREFAAEATRYVACPVRLQDMAVHPGGYYPQKCKAKGCCGPVWECDQDGNPVSERNQ